jgi:hypothetical protein
MFSMRIYIGQRAHQLVFEILLLLLVNGHPTMQA